MFRAVFASVAHSRADHFVLDTDHHGGGAVDIADVSGHNDGRADVNRRGGPGGLVECLPRTTRRVAAGGVCQPINGDNESVRRHSVRKNRLPVGISELGITVSLVRGTGSYTD